MKAFLAFVTLLAVGVVGACGGASSSNDSSSTQQSGEATACTYPANADTTSDASGAGCSAAPPAKLCQVSNGATVLPDGGVSGGTETCTPMCGSSDYELTCKSASIQGGDIPAPSSSLGCTIIAIPTPSDALFYCCPCAK